ncbi:hypothetical protein [Nesterenkonia sp. CF4.4]|uniref:hypothetical protein n=1 Tax=Nesterenkonia sp. CF4.4 TaxID=3373079 RepID=UPI003EE43EC4
MPDIQSYPEAVGSFLRAYRKENRLTLEAVARAGHKYGARWGVASIRNIEAGKAALTVPTLITLALSLRKLTGKSLTLSELTGEGSSISLGADKSLPVTRAWLAEVMAGSAIELDFNDRAEAARLRSEITEQEEAEAFGQPNRVHDRTGAARQRSGMTEQEEAESFRQSDEVHDRNLSHIDDAAVQEALWEDRLQPPEPPEEPEEPRGPGEPQELFDDQPPSLAETRAAEALKIDPLELKLWAWTLYGRSLEQESIARVGQDASPQKRGAATRALIREIRSHRGHNA